MPMANTAKQAMTISGDGMRAQPRLISNNNPADRNGTRICSLFCFTGNANCHALADLFVGNCADSIGKFVCIYYPDLSPHTDLEYHLMLQEFFRWLCPGLGAKEGQTVTCREDHLALHQADPSVC